MPRKLLSGCAIIAAALTFSAIAVADPTNSKNSGQLQVVCGGETLTATVFGAGEFTPATINGSTSVFVPVSFDLFITFTPPGGQPITVHDTSAKDAPLTNLTTCTIPLQTLFGATVEGTVTGFFTPR
jgi:hypothetical protein